MIARNDHPNSLQMLVLVLNEMVLVLETRLRDSCDQCRQVTPSGSLRCDRCGAIVTVDRYSGSLQWIVAVVYLRWLIQEGSPKELLNKRR